VHVLAGRAVEEITVGDIVTQAQISRSAFYTQFAGIDELALSVLTETLDDLSVRLSQRVASPETDREDVMRSVLIAFVHHVEDNRALYTSVLSLPFTHLTHARFVDALAVHVADLIEAEGLIRDATRIRATSAYVAGGMLAVLHLWLSGEISGTAERVVEELIALRPPGMPGQPTG
jgi:AcrR family transcriptional regulator